MKSYELIPLENKTEELICTCIVRKKLHKLSKVLSKKKWEKVRDRLQKKYCWLDGCFLCPNLEIRKK